MEQVFDFREFVLNITKRLKGILIFALILAVLFGGLGYIKANSDVYMTTYTATVNMTGGNKEADVLTGTMKNLTAILDSDYFYNNIVNEIRKNMTSGEFEEIFSTNKELSINDIKDVIVLSIKGNVILIDISSSDKELSKEACEIGINYIVNEVPNMIHNTTVSALGSQTVNLSEQKGESTFKMVALFAALGLILGIGLGVIWIFFVDVFDLKLQSADDLRKFGLPVLGEINSK